MSSPQKKRYPTGAQTLLSNTGGSPCLPPRLSTTTGHPGQSFQGTNVEIHMQPDYDIKASVSTALYPRSSPAAVGLKGCRLTS